MSSPAYSIVIPIFNEEEALPELAKRISAVADRLDGAVEIILVDDGSRDRSYPISLDLTERDPRFKLIRLSRNFGHQIAITAGLDVASGEAVVVIDADLQDPPEVIIEMAARWREGYAVVNAVRKAREGESFFKRVTSSLFYRFLSRLTDVDIPVDVGDFRLVDRRALEVFRAMRENNRYVRGMFSWLGFEQTRVVYTRSRRVAGRTKYPLKRMIRFASDAVLSFSNVPLRLALNIGFILAGIAVLGGIAAAVSKLSGALVVPGWASLAVAICFLGALQLMVLGIIGEYIARIYDEVKGRPLYVVREVRGISNSVDLGPRRVVTAATSSVGGVDAGGSAPPSST